MTNTLSSKQDRFSSVVGLASAGVACFIPRLHGFYTTRKTAILIPAACGAIAVVSWKYLLTKPLSTRELKCSVCASIRGSTISVFSGCILPSVALAVIGFKRKPFLLKNKQAVNHFLKVLTQPYNTADKPYIFGLWAMQGTLGFGLASWQFSEYMYFK
jgi:hypothetical protein